MERDGRAAVGKGHNGLAGQPQQVEQGQQEKQSAEVARHLAQTADLIVAWIRQGEADNMPVSRFSTGYEARENCSLPLSKDGVDDTVVFETMQTVLTSSVNPWTGRFVDKLYTAPLPLGVAAETLLAALNANAHVMSASPMLCLAEEACVAGLATLCGWDSDMADGLTMPGGSSSNTLALQTAFNALHPGFQEEGLDAVVATGVRLGRSPAASRPLTFTSEQGHYSIDKAAIACGMGLRGVVKVPCDSSGRMDAQALDKMLTAAFDDHEGTKSAQPGLPVFVNATAGSTVMGAFDPLCDIAAVCAKHLYQGIAYPLWLHVDGSWGGPVLFSEKHSQRMRGVHQCDSLTINPHKLLNVPLQCSFALFKNGENLSHNALDAPYLFHTSDSSSDASSSKAPSATAAAMARKVRRRENPAQMNFGCGRRGDALKMYLMWLSKGSAYFGHLVDQGITWAERIVAHIQDTSALRARLELASSGDGALFLQVCLRPRLIEGSTVAQRSQATRQVHAELRRRRRFAVDFAPLGQGQGDFIRIVTHPSSPFETFVELIEEIATLSDQLSATGKASSNGEV